jgi:hypothetical protein
MAIVVFFQFLGGAIILSAAQTIFSNSLRDLLTQHLSQITAERVIAAGARSVRDVVSGPELTIALEDYSTSVQRVMYMGIALGGAAFLFCWGLGWKDVRQKKETMNPARIEESSGGLPLDKETK